jgi:hypothetical protein
LTTRTSLVPMTRPVTGDITWKTKFTFPHFLSIANQSISIVLKTKQQEIEKMCLSSFIIC